MRNSRTTDTSLYANNIFKLEIVLYEFFVVCTCGNRPRITSWLGLGPVRGPFCLRRRHGPKSLLRPTGATKPRPRSNSSSDIPKSRSMMHPSYCSPHSKHIRRKKDSKYPRKGCHHHIKCTTTTLLAALMERRPLNSATLVTATHKELVRASDGTGAQVRVWIINKCKAQMIKEGLYNM